jgi:undecaprenyl diphosphate synthase
MWPEFDADDLADALSSFSRRERRFGGLPSLSLEPAESA